MIEKVEKMDMFQIELIIAQHGVCFQVIGNVVVSYSSLCPWDIFSPLDGDCD